jgi:hypothetical protein
MMLLKQHNGWRAASAMTAARHGSVRRSGSTHKPDVLVLERK